MRADKVMLIEYVDGSLYCQHADGTQIFSESNEKEMNIRVEKKGFAPVNYTKDKKIRVPSNDDMDDWLDLEEIRSVDSWVTTCSLPD